MESGRWISLSDDQRPPEPLEQADPVHDDEPELVIGSSVIKHHREAL
jgi:hypothetical protein